MVAARHITLALDLCVPVGTPDAQLDVLRETIEDAVNDALPDAFDAQVFGWHVRDVEWDGVEAT